MAVPGVFARIRRPEYTGENRCLPCTAVNVVIAVGVAVLVVWFGHGVGALVGGVLVGLVVFVVSIALIAVRGYLIPGTPRLTQEYFPAWILRWFDHYDASGTLPEDRNVEGVLKQFGVVEECEDEDDLCLAPEFRSAWREQITLVKHDTTARDSLAHLIEVDSDAVSIEEVGTAFVAQVGGRTVSQWESRAAFLADIAAANVLRERSSAWSQTDIEQRAQLIGGLRVFLEQCPVCDGPVSFDEDVVKSCCRSIDVVTMNCEDCGARLFEVEHHE